MRRGVGVLVAVGLLLTGCTALGFQPSPTTTTYLDESGSEVTVDWVDYPAHEGNDGELLIGYPDQAQIEPIARDLLEHVRIAVSDASGFALASSEPESEWFDDENWFPADGNGYGGDAMLITVNCCDFSSDGAPRRSEWQGVIDAASAAVEPAGFREFVLDDPLEWCGAPAEQCWRWSGWATDGVQWVSIMIQDGALDPTGDAVQEAKNANRPVATVQFGYGATVVPTGLSDEYARAIDQFIGLKQPRATTSD